jgi:arylformamidase
MKFQITIDDFDYQSDLSKGKSIAITLLPNGSQPNHFGAPECTSETLIAGEFIGDTKRGGSCNVNQLTIIPHCNGTHTESISHLINDLIPVYKAINQSLFPCALITLKPISGKHNTEAYRPSVDESNYVITREMLELNLESYSNQQLNGVVIRTLPNSEAKQTTCYDQQNYPTYLTNDAMSYLVEREVSHLLVDFPSVDKMYDQGMLSNHRLFWNLASEQVTLSNECKVNRTITEMIYANSQLEDGFYLCNLQIPEIETDAVPSQPQLYSLEKIELSS